MARRVLVLVDEDHRLVRDGLAALLERQPDFTVLAPAQGVNVAVAQVRQTRPHVVLVDAALAGDNGHTVVERIRRTAPDSRVIVIDVLPKGQDVIEFIRAGASGFIVKGATIDDFVRTVRSVADGAKVVPASLQVPALAQRLEHLNSV